MSYAVSAKWSSMQPRKEAKDALRTTVEESTL